VDKAFVQIVAAEDVAALIVEPVLGEGGFVVPPEDYLPALKKRCEEHGIVFIADEVQMGFGRTGKMFAIEHSGVEPDLVVMAKSIAAGMPLSAVVGRAEVVDAPVEGGIGGTYPGNPAALDKKCHKSVYKAGEGFVESNGAVHLVRNQGKAEAVLYATYIVPTKTPAEGLVLDDPQPKGCNVR
jgi:acetylornithine/succinyldiaminopimelate/putrescine aminotransferase